MGVLRKARLARLVRHSLIFIALPSDIHENVSPYRGTKGEGEREGWLEVFAALQYYGNILPLIDSLSCDLLDKVNIMNYSAAGGS